jgi:hypothetical protein
MMKLHCFGGVAFEYFYVVEAPLVAGVDGIEGAARWGVVLGVHFDVVCVKNCIFLLGNRGM